MLALLKFKWVVAPSNGCCPPLGEGGPSHLAWATQPRVEADPRGSNPTHAFAPVREALRRAASECRRDRLGA